jgi:hypothetical protein
MNNAKVESMFKNKALELIQSLHAKFPAQLSIPLIMLRNTDAQLALGTYVESVHTPYASRIAAHDTTFFLTGDIATPQLDSSMLTMVRSLWHDLSSDEQDSIWDYFQIFERLVKAHR